jgi:hypothetical protein
VIALYSMFVILLGSTKFLVARRAKSLEKKYARVAKDTEDLAKQHSGTPVAHGRVDPLTVAKRQFLLGQLVQQRDHIEAKCLRWQARADSLGKLFTGLRALRGRKVPYLVGVLDTVSVLGLLDWLGFGDTVSVHRVVELVSGLLNGLLNR